MTRIVLLGVAGVLGFTATVAAQPVGSPNNGGSGYGFNPNVMPNIFNPRTQPLSPYLNLVRGSNPGVNYYYGVRPGTVGGAGPMGGGPFMAPGGNRPTTFPVSFGDPDAVPLPEPGEGYIIPPAGHPVVFNNTMGFFPGGAGKQGGPRPGIGGGNRPTTPRK